MLSSGWVTDSTRACAQVAAGTAEDDNATMPRRLKDQDQLAFSSHEVLIARAALYIARYHRDSVAADDGSFQTLTGVEMADVIRLMEELDELTGFNREVRQVLEQRLAYLGALPDTELAQSLGHAREVVREATRLGVAVPVGLQPRMDSAADRAPHHEPF